MAVVHHNARLVFLATPHSASRAVSEAIVSIGGRRSRRHHDTLQDLVGADLVSWDDLASYIVVTTVRNHFDALVTWWWARGRGRSFSSFLLLLVTLDGPVKDDRLYRKWFDSADLALRYENLERQLGDLLEARLGTRPALPHVGVSPGKGDWRSYYTRELRHLVEEVFAEELSDLGYSWDVDPVSLEPIRRRPEWRRRSLNPSHS